MAIICPISLAEAYSNIDTGQSHYPKSVMFAWCYSILDNSKPPSIHDKLTIISKFHYGYLNLKLNTNILVYAFNCKRHAPHAVSSSLKLFHCEKI